MAVIALFENRTQAEEAIRGLQARGVPADEINIVMSDDEEAAELADETGADATAEQAPAGIVGGFGDIPVEVRTLLIQDLGPLIAGGPLATTVTGPATDAGIEGLVGALELIGIPTEDAVRIREGVRNGGVLLVINVDEADSQTVADELRRFQRDDQPPRWV